MAARRCLSVLFVVASSGALLCPPLAPRRGAAFTGPLRAAAGVDTPVELLKARVRGLLDEVSSKLSDGATMPDSAMRLEDAYARESHEDMYVGFLEFFMDLKIDYDIGDDDMIRPTVHPCTDADDEVTQEKLAPLYNTAMIMLQDQEPEVKLGIWRLIVDKLADRVGLSNKELGIWATEILQGA